MNSFKITYHYDDIIKPNQTNSINNRRKYLLNLQRPMTDEENKELDKLSYMVLLQKEISYQKRKYKNAKKNNDEYYHY
jgi:hypothetical protein